jgi:hypothetical protein
VVDLGDRVGNKGRIARSRGALTCLLLAQSYDPRQPFLVGFAAIPWSTAVLLLFTFGKQRLIHPDPDGDR